MQGKTHVAVGVVTLGCLCVAFPDGIQVMNQTISPQVAMLTAAIGSYLPDIDIERSALGQKYKLISKHLKHRGFTHTLVMPAIFLTLLLVSIFIPPNFIVYFNILLDIMGVLVIAKLVYKLGVKHGSADLDDIMQAMCFSLVLSITLSDIYTIVVFTSCIFGILFGWVMHIVADMCNGKGVPLLPGMKRMHIMSVLTGSWQEVVWLVAYIAVVVIITIKGVYL